MENKVLKILYDGDNIVFIIRTDDDDFIWYWAVEKKWVEKYFNYPCDNLSIEAAEIYCNDEANGDEGFSGASFDTIEEAEADYMEER